MKQVKLKKVTIAEVKNLQNELYHFAEVHSLGFNYWSEEDFFNALLMVDIAKRLCFLFRSKIESERSSFSLSLKASEAVILLKCCHWQRSNRGDYEKNIAEKYKGILDQQLKSIGNPQGESSTYTFLLNE